MKKEQWYCDIDDCNEIANIKGQEMQVVFFTDQTEGRSTKPYLYTVKMDICNSCLSKRHNGLDIIAVGAQGHNTYRFRKQI